VASVSKYDPDEPRDDHGKWSAGGGGGGGGTSEAGGGGPSLKERAAASMQDPAFRTEHADRLARADFEARRNFPRDPHSEDANQAVSSWQHSEAGRILTEHDAHGGDADLKRAAEEGRAYARGSQKTELTEQHEEAMRSIADRKPDLEQERAAQAARDAGAVPSLPASTQAVIDEHEALKTANSAKLDEIGKDLHEAHQQALLSLHELHGVASEEDVENLPSHYDLAEHYGNTHADFAGEGEHGYEEIGEHIVGREPIYPPEGIELDENDKPEPWSPTSGYTAEHESILSIDEDTGRADPWSHDLFHESLGGDEYPHLEYDEHGAPSPWGPSEGHSPGQQAEHRAAYESEAATYHQAAAEHKAEYERVAADYEQHRVADKADYTAKVEQYKQAIAERERETQAKAEKAQAHLEALHEKQVAALSSIRDMDKAEGKSSAKAQKELDKIGDDEIHEHVSAMAPFAGKTQNDDGEFHDAETEQLHRNARETYESDLSAAGESLHQDDRPSTFDDTHNNLKESARVTAKAIRELARFTGRAARLPAKAKKSANRPGADPSASVWGMAAPNRFKLRLTKLDLISLVDTPAQESAAIRLIKRKDGSEQMEATLSARLAKIGEGADPLAYFWAFTCTSPDGAAYHDLQGDAIQPDFLKAAEDWLHTGGAMDEMHDGAANNRAAFAFPWDPEIAVAMLGPEVGKLVKTSGLMIAMRPTTEQLAKLRNGEFNGVSIAGSGVRELVKAAGAKCPSCGAYGKPDDKGNCPSCGKAMKRARRPTVSTLKAALTTADRDALPDGSFLYIEPGGSKDADGKTTPRSHRMFPYRDSTGTIDIAHLRAAAQDIPKSSLAKDLQSKLQIRAEKLLGQQHSKRSIRKRPVLTSSVDGHQHQIDLDDPADGWSDQLTTSYNTSEGAEQGHCHAWVYDEAGAITIAEDSGHMHAVDAVVPADVIRQAALNDSGTRCPGCSEMCEEGCRFCPKCGCAMDRSGGAPAAVTDGDRGSGPNVILIAARAPATISTPAEGASTVKSITEEHQMADPNELTALKAENALLKNLATLTDAQRDHHNRLLAKGIKSDADAFLVLDRAQRNTVLAEIDKANVEVYTSKSNGRVYRMSDDIEKIEAAKQTDAMLEMTKRAEDKERELDFIKRAGELIPGCYKGVKNNVPARLIKAIRAEFKEPAEFAEAEKALKQYEAAFVMLSKAGGYSSTDDTATDSPAKRFETAVNDFAKRNNLSYAAAIAKATESDPEIRRLYNEASLLAS
jgi:hypothetical protein